MYMNNKPTWIVQARQDSNATHTSNGPSLSFKMGEIVFSSSLLSPESYHSSSLPKADTVGEAILEVLIGHGISPYTWA